MFEFSLLFVVFSVFTKLFLWPWRCLPGLSLLQILFWAKRKIMSTNNLVLISYKFGKRCNLTWQIRFVGICFKIFYFFKGVFFLTFVCISLFGRGERNCANIQLVKVAGFVFFWNVKRDWWWLCFDDGCCIYVLNSNSQRLLKHTSSTFNKKAEIASIRELIKWHRFVLFIDMLSSADWQVFLCI